ncbi:DUF2752 domain-containing protein [Ruminococcus flavefaciens]|uniref:DUF2752 domain-containing protein n=1 Tax=Ruminococcus flavefaciens TaxID=1265 RepID=UPI0026F2192B|nr:DUF2752 domain-containing protein [Ruminococcus flavefaciens]MDD7518043.1 DUF2752 domain-containing protein [Ruminococcus flavefaciens]MDY5692947.1 DUF2752 domain-containing protein [Ruminococcus flavefaciens]
MSRRVRVVIAVLFPCAAALVFAFRENIIGFAGDLPRCSVHIMTGLWCTGCGNTRSLTALFNGQLWRAVRCNPTIPFFALVIVLFYAETVTGIWNDEIKLLPRRRRTWFIILGVFLVFFVLRNIFPVLAPPL